jgi:hypothetical protein
MIEWLTSVQGAKTVMGVLLCLAGINNAYGASRVHYIPAVWWQIKRSEHPLRYWLVFSVYIFVILSGIDLVIGGIFRVHLFWS